MTHLVQFRAVCARLSRAAPTPRDVGTPPRRRRDVVTPPRRCSPMSSRPRAREAGARRAPARAGRRPSTQDVQRRTDVGAAHSPRTRD